jgi:hypothetical protein
MGLVRGAISKRVASALSGLGDVAVAEGDEPTARRFYDESLALFRELQDRARARVLPPRSAENSERPLFPRRGI